MSDPLRVEPEVYGFAPEDPVRVSSASACSITISGEKRRAVQSYLTRLGPELRRRHGRQSKYTPEQVHESVLALGLRVDWLCWAYMLHCSPVDFETIHSAAGEVCDRSGMWTAVADVFFQGNTAFEPTVVADVLSSGGGEAVAGAAAAVGWLGEVDWTALLDLGSAG